MTSDSASRVTRSRWHLAGALALLAVVGVLRAQEPEAPPATGAPAPAENPPAPGPTATTAPAAGTAPAPKPGRTQDRFEPSEKVRADFDVSFPVDI
jgi:hypothetical protein